jgi:hypothetical protein
MMSYATVQAVGQARLADLHAQARHHALARAARQARRPRPQSTDRPPGLMAALTRWARQPRRTACGGAPAAP